MNGLGLVWGQRMLKVVKRFRYVDFMVLRICDRRIDVIGWGNSIAGVEQDEIDGKDVGFEGFGALLASRACGEPSL